MTIKALNPFLKKKCPQAFFTVGAGTFMGYRVAIDAQNWMYRHMATARKHIINKTDVAVEMPCEIKIRREWLRLALEFAALWLGAGVTPVFVFDGEHPPEKFHAHEKRAADRREAREKIETAYAEMRELDILARTSEKVEALRALLRGYTTVSRDDSAMFRDALSALGFPVLRAEADAEKLCAALGASGKVAAVVSTDTDALPLGSPLIVTDISGGWAGAPPTCTCVSLPAVLEGLGWTDAGGFARFVDLCIMSGCDFNENIPGIGVAKSYALLCAHGSIDNLPSKYDITCLNHVRCREIFSQQGAKGGLHPEDVAVSTGPLALDEARLAEDGRQALDDFNLGGQMHSLVNAYNHVPPPSDVPPGFKPTPSSTQTDAPPGFRKIRPERPHQNGGTRVNIPGAPSFHEPSDTAQSYESNAPNTPNTQPRVLFPTNPVASLMLTSAIQLITSQPPTSYTSITVSLDPASAQPEYLPRPKIKIVIKKTAEVTSEPVEEK